jgi:hypothetical protein
MNDSVLAKFRRLRRRFLGAGIVVLIFVVAWLMNHLGPGTGLGLGAGLVPGSKQAVDLPRPTPTDSPEPMRVVVQDDRYVVAGSEQTLQQIVQAAQTSHPAGGAAVKIVSEPDSRVGAQRDLEAALDQAGLSWSLEAEPDVP